MVISRVQVHPTGLCIPVDRCKGNFRAAEDLPGVEAKVNRLLTDCYGNVCGGVCTSADGIILQEHEPGISATGGFGVDFTPDPLRSKHSLPVALASDQWRLLHRQGLEEVHGHGT